MKPFGQTLLLWRLRRGLSQSQMARKAGIPRPNLSAMERGRREVSLKTLRALAMALGIRPGLLADGVVPQETGRARLFSRARMEKLAGHVSQNLPLLDSADRNLAKKIQLTMRSRLSLADLKKEKRRLGRQCDRNWLSMSHLPSSVVQSCVERICNAKSSR